jgi:hypothetical protein
MWHRSPSRESLSAATLFLIFDRFQFPWSINVKAVLLPSWISDLFRPFTQDVLFLNQ